MRTEWRLRKGKLELALWQAQDIISPNDFDNEGQTSLSFVAKNRIYKNYRLQT